MSARIRKRNSGCDWCGKRTDSLPGPKAIPWVVEIIDPDTHTCLCAKCFEKFMKPWRKADVLVQERLRSEP